MDLADYDVVADDCDLIVGPFTAKLSTSNTGASRQLVSSSSCKDSSILSTAAVATKLAQSSSGPVHPSLARYLSAVENNVYGGGNPIIARASSASRPASAFPQQDRKSTASVVSSQALGTPPGTQGSAQPRPAPISDSPTTDPPDPLVPRIYGDILAGGGDGVDGDMTTAAKKGSRLFRRSSSRCIAPNPGGANTTATSAARSQQVCSDVIAAGAGAWPAADYCATRRASALPCVDVEGDRSGQRLLRHHSLNSGEPAARIMVAVQSLTAPGLQGCEGAGPCATATAGPLSDRQTCGTTSPRPRAPTVVIPSVADPASRSASGSPRMLNKLLSGSLMSPRRMEQPSRRTSKERRGSFGGLRDLFSRQPSWRNSEAGSILERRGSSGGQRDEMSQDLASIGGGRQASGVFKRPASPLVAWV